MSRTRWKAEVLDEDGNVVWEVLVYEFPEPALRHDLHVKGYRIHKASKPKRGTPRSPVYSDLDPINSITAAHEADARRSTNDTRVLVYLIAHAGEWVSRETIRKIGGDQGDRRARSLRDINWPIETKQLAPGDPWHIRLNLPDAARYASRIFGGGDDDPTLFDD